MSNVNTASPTWGNGTTDNADASSIYSGISIVTLSLPGDKVVLSGTASMVGITSGNEVFRFGIFNSLGSSGTTGWQGFFVQNAAIAAGTLRERDAVNTGAFTSTTGAGAALGSMTNPNTALTSTNYSFLFSIERDATGQALISTSLKRVSDGVDFASLTGVVVPLPKTFTFDRVGFQGTTNLNADQIQMSNVDFTLTTVPEPSVTCLAGLVCLLGCSRRR